MKRLIAACVLTTIAILTAGCVQKYVAPESGPTAKLRYETNTNDLTMLTRYDTALCPNKPVGQRVASTSNDFLDQGKASPIEMIGTSGAMETRIREQLVEAGKPFVFQVEASRTATAYTTGYTCKVSGGFSPRPGQEYEISFQVGSGSCQARVFRLSRGVNAQAVRTMDLTQRYIRAFDDQDFCTWRAASNAVADERPDSVESPVVSQNPNKIQPTAAAPGSELQEALDSGRASSALPPSATIAAASAQTPQDPTQKGDRWQPNRGDRWRYRLIDGRRPVGTVTIEIVEAENRRVLERITREGFPGFSLDRSVSPEFDTKAFLPSVQMPGGFKLFELSAYFPPGSKLESGARLGELPGEMLILTVGKRNLVWQTRVVGMERVRVPAGEFDAWKIEATSSVLTPHEDLKIVYHIWYSPVMQRAVKTVLAFNSRIAIASESQTLELAGFDKAK